MPRESPNPFLSPKPPDPRKFTKKLEGSFEFFRAAEDEVHKIEERIKIAEFNQEAYAFEAETPLAFAEKSIDFQSLFKNITKITHKRALCCTY